MEVTAPETRGVDATMVATQSRGYVELFLALGRALVAAGHRPREQRHSGSALREPEPTGYPRAPCGNSGRCWRRQLPTPSSLMRRGVGLRNWGTRRRAES
jgi:hypothetical protein